MQPALKDSHAIMADGYRLPLREWPASGAPKARVLAVHGLNDYRQAFESLGLFLSSRGISVIAYDQRGFGDTLGRGVWHGGRLLASDLRTLIDLIKRQRPDLPLYLVGESMGAAVALVVLASEPEAAEGTVLLSPAVWTRELTPFYQRLALWIGAHTTPGMRLNGGMINIRASDNEEMLQALEQDPLVIQSTRIDVLYGLADLMDMAMPTSSIPGEFMLLYGHQDAMIPGDPICALLRTLDNGSTRLTAIAYENGHHTLMRDLQSARVLQDIADWIESPARPSGNTAKMQDYCEGRQ